VTLVLLEKAARRFGDQTVLEGADLQVERGDRIGVVGPNGSGKTTLLRLVAGWDRPDGGSRRASKNLRIAFLQQVPSFERGITIRRAALSGAQGLADLERRLEEIHEELARDPRSKALQSELARVQERFEALGGHSLPHRLEQILGGLGFPPEELDKEVEVLSGGEKARVQLASVLLAGADLLLLDEPTNHLDLEGIQFLEGLLHSGDYTFLVVSHDRAFLDNVARSIVEVDRGRLKRWKGNYSEYVRAREREEIFRLKEWKKQQEFKEKQEDFYRRYHYGQRSREAKSRLKRVRRMEPLEKPQGERRGPKVRLRTGEAPRRGLEVLRAEEMAVAVGEGRVLLEGVDLRVLAGERVGIVGPNGSGKTTLLQVLAGRRPPFAGSLERHPQARVGWFDQELQGLVPGRTVLETLRDAAGPGPDDEALRAHLALFLFTKDQVEKSVENLSGGEARRLLLAALTWNPAGLLFLDEPTNHLDIQAREALEEALLGFGGTLVFVSHDRYFLDRVATQTWFLEPPRLLAFPGGWKEAQALKKEVREKEESPSFREKKEEGRKDRGGSSPSRKDGARQGKKVNLFKLERLEEKIFALEEEKEELEASLGEPRVYLDPGETRRVKARLEEIGAELEELYKEWEETGSP